MEGDTHYSGRARGPQEGTLNPIKPKVEADGDVVVFEVPGVGTARIQNRDIQFTLPPGFLANIRLGFIGDLELSELRSVGKREEPQNVIVHLPAAHIAQFSVVSGEQLSVLQIQANVGQPHEPIVF